MEREVWEGRGEGEVGVVFVCMFVFFLGGEEGAERESRVCAGRKREEGEGAGGSDAGLNDVVFLQAVARVHPTWRPCPCGHDPHGPGPKRFYPRLSP